MKDNDNIIDLLNSLLKSIKKIMKKKYLEIVRDSDGAVVKRFDITGKTDRSVDRLENGLSVNMNHASFSLRFGEYNREMPEVDNETRSNQNRKRKQQ